MSRNLKTVSYSNSKVCLSCVLDVSDHHELISTDRSFEWSLSTLPPESLPTLKPPIFVSKNTFFIVKCRSKVIDTASNSTSLKETLFEYPLLQSIHASITLDEKKHVIIIRTDSYPESCPLSSSEIIMTLGQDGSTNEMFFMRADIRFKDHTESNANIIYCVDSIHLFRAKLHYTSFPPSSRKVEDFFFLSRPADTTSLKYLQSKVLSSLFSLLTASWVAVTGRSKDPAMLDKADEVDKHNRVFFVNGWNAWSFCGSVQQGHSLPLYSLPHVFAKSFHSGGPALKFNLEKVDGCREWIASDMFTLLADRIDRKGVVVGFLSQKQQFGCITADEGYSILSVYTAHDGAEVRDRRVATDWLCVQVVCQLPADPFASYMHLAGLVNGAQRLIDLPTDGFAATLAHLQRIRVAGDAREATPGSLRQPDEQPVAGRLPVGWCSWYHFYENIGEACLDENIDQLHKLDIKVRSTLENTSGSSSGPAGLTRSFNLFQVDDGYQSAWGDWSLLKPKEFPCQSLQPLVSRIKAEGLVPGLWMAPFSCDKHSEVARLHPEWVLRGNKGVPVNSANCGKWFFGLDVTHPGVQQFVRESLRLAVETWGFEYLKLDFLYSAVLGAKDGTLLDKGLTGAQAMQVGMSLINDTMEELKGRDFTLLGCGAALGSVIGHVHLNRISADAGLTWFPTLGPIPYSDKWNLPSASNMIRNSICRLSMHNRWWVNDPDCIILRTSTAFSEEEIVGIAVVKALSGGPFIISDNLASVSPRRLRIAKQLIPPTGLAATAIDLLDKEVPELLRLKMSRSSAQGGDCLCCACGGKDSWILMGVCNWDEFAKTHCIPTSQLMDYGATLVRRLHVFNFFKQTYSCVDVGAPLLRTDVIPAHTADILAVRADSCDCRDGGRPLYLGCNFHFSCGLEVDYMRYEEGTFAGPWNRTYSRRLSLRIKDQFGIRGKELAEDECSVWVYLPLPADIQSRSRKVTGTIANRNSLATDSFGIVRIGEIDVCVISRGVSSGAAEVVAGSRSVRGVVLRVPIKFGTYEERLASVKVDDIELYW